MFVETKTNYLFSILVFYHEPTAFQTYIPVDLIQIKVIVLLTVLTFHLIIQILPLIMSVILQN